MEKPGYAAAVSTQPDQFDKNENINKHKGGTSSSYRAAKLKRDHPEVAASVTPA